MDVSVARNGFRGIALLLGALSIGLAVSNSVAPDDRWVIENLGRSVAVLIGVLPAVTIVAGLWLSTRWSIGGRVLALAGAIAFGVLTWWTIVVPMLVLLLSWCALVAARSPVTARQER